MEVAQVRALLEQVDLFRHARAESLEAMAKLGRVRRFGKGKRLMHQGATSASMYVILDGSVRVQRSHPDLREPVVLAELGCGEVVGEMGVLDGEPRSASVVALESTQALELTPQVLQETVLRDQEVAGALLRVLSRRLRSTNELVRQPADEERSNP
jgi:CRP/FNR family transcriptional regulator, cyclic AMP receptor protein